MPSAERRGGARAEEWSVAQHKGELIRTASGRAPLQIACSTSTPSSIRHSPSSQATLLPSLPATTSTTSSQATHTFGATLFVVYLHLYRPPDTMASPIKLYYFPASSFARVAHYGAIVAGLPTEQVVVDILAGAQQQPPFSEILPYGQVPTIDDNGFILAEVPPDLS